MDFIKDPHKIEEKSMEIIERKIRGFTFTPRQKPIVKRVVHATGDSSYAAMLAFSPQAVEAALSALLANEPIYCDVEMVRTGLSRLGLQQLGIKPVCLIHDLEIKKEAKKRGITRAMAAMEHAVRECPDGGIFVIGNAPTSLFHLLRAVDEGRAKPALVIGVPVGFVGAAEAKELLTAYSLPWITVRGEKGGSPVAAAIVNALVNLALESKEARA